MTIYSTKKCLACQKVKEYLNQKGIKFEEIDISKMTTTEQRYLLKKAGRISVPLIEHKNKFYFSLKELKEIL